MPTITPGYVYTFIALVAVCSLLLLSFIAYADALRVSSEAKQLKNLMSYVAAKSTELLTLTLTTNATSQIFLQMPTSIGSKEYWLQMHNGSVGAWVEGGLGNTPVNGTDMRVYLPEVASATGYYVGGYGAALLQCHLNAGTPTIELESSS